MTDKKRSLELDFLRFVAVILVLLRHLEPLPHDLPAWFEPFVDRIATMGWIGVDLFFVLSGYLISGLLFREYLQDGGIDFRRFFVRRGLKIYPSFYLLIAFTVTTAFVMKWNHPWKRVMAELFFYQNYAPNLWGHTWSLAVEEHFYLILPVLLIFLIHRHRAAAPMNPFTAVPRIILAVAVLALAGRLLTWWSIRHNPENAFDKIIVPTHLRIDSLAMGVLISYAHHFHTARLIEWVRRRRWALIGMFVLGALPAAIWEVLTSPFVYTIDLTLLYLGMGSILLLSLVHRLPGGAFFKFGAYLGSFSYSIYLWHRVVTTFVGVALHRWPAMPWWLRIGSILGGALILGVVMSKLVEIPMLAIRDRYFPSALARKPSAQGLPTGAAASSTEAPC